MSTTKAKSYHSITIGNKNTWDDWHLVPTSRPLVNPPRVKTKYIDIPGASGSIDLTDVISGKPIYDNRTGNWEFFVINSKQLEPNSSYGEWYSRYTSIMQYLQGQEFDAILDDDDQYYYTGRFSVSGWSSEKGNSIITISYNVDPYKRERFRDAKHWLWNPFNFENGIIRGYANFIVRGQLSVIYDALELTETPTITCSTNGTTLTFNGVTYELLEGANEMVGMTFQEGPNPLTFNGNGRIIIEAVGGLL